MLKFDSKSGYANYKASKYYYNQGKKEFDLYREETEAISQNLKQLDDTQLAQWSALIDSSRKNLAKAKSFLDNIKSKDRFYGNAVNARKNVKIGQTNLRTAEKQMEYFQKVLDRK
jgi:hypothetical protein